MPFDGKPELLAPAGTLEAVATVLDAGADAVYAGGKSLNMRMHRSGYNFGDDELAAAVALVHDRGKKIYVTVNNLVFDSELAELREFLHFLGRLGPDAIIVQDIGVATLALEQCTNIPLHASTMMNVHNVETATALSLMGFTRFIASRDIPLHEIRHIAEKSRLEAECFVHGDMCIAQSSQCHLSSIAFGESSNRGRCMKPCRWRWEVTARTGDPDLSGVSEGYLLARKDLCLFQHIPALVRHGIASLKLEGRMRSADFLAPLVKAYRQAIDAYAEDPYHYRTLAKTMQALWSRRTRELSTCHSFGNPGSSSVDPSGKREARFFSHEAPDSVLTRTWTGNASDSIRAVELITHVSGAEAAEAAAEAGAEAVYIGGDVFVHHSPSWGVDWLRGFARGMGETGRRVAVLSPRITDPGDMAEWRGLLGKLRGIPGLGIGAANLGALRAAYEARLRILVADFSLNVTNSVAADELSTFGAVRVTCSPELDIRRLTELARASRMPIEMVGQGPLPGMLLEYCVIAAATGDRQEDVCSMECRRARFALRDSAGHEFRIEPDHRCRNHLFAHADVCVLPNLPRILGTGVCGIRIEAQLESPAAVKAVTGVYRRALDALARGESFDVGGAIAALEEATGRAVSDGPFAFGDFPEEPASPDTMLQGNAAEESRDPSHALAVEA